MERCGRAWQLIAGSAYGLPAKARTHSPLFYVHLEMEARGAAEIPAAYSERAVYIAKGEVEIGGQRLLSGQMAILKADASAIRAAQPSTVMVLGGEPVGERFLYWNFVSSSQDRLRQASQDWKDGLMRLPDADDQEFIPLPEAEPAERSTPE